MNTLFGGRVPNFFFVNALLNNIMALVDFVKFCAVTIQGEKISGRGRLREDAPLHGPSV